MQLARLARLVPNNPDSGVLIEFPLAVRRTVISQIVGSMQLSTARSRTRALWVMEVVGAAFDLPMEDADVIEKSLDVYRRWLLEPSGQPPAVSLDYSFFAQRMFVQFSLLFQDRVTQSMSVVLLSRHGALCAQVLNVLVTVARRSLLDAPSWQILLRVLLGVTDELLTRERTDAPCLESELCVPLLMSLFECWIRSGVQSAEMWDFLLQMSRGWRKRRETVTIVAAVTMGLTRRAIRTTSGDTKGSATVDFSAVDMSSSLEKRVFHASIEGVADEHASFAWLRMCYLLVDFFDSPDPALHLAAVRGLSDVIDALLAVGNDRDPHGPAHQPLSPDGNTILGLFGAPLFRVASNPEPSLVSGRAAACAALCRIYCSRTGPFLTWYTSRFFSLLAQAVMVPECFGAVITNCETLFTQDLIGAHALIPSFLVAMERFLLAKTPAADDPLLRRSCITVLGSIISLPSQLTKAPLAVPASVEASASLHVDSYAGLREPIDRILLGALDSETDESNLQAIVSLLFVYGVVEAEQRPAILARVLAVTLNVAAGSGYPSVVFGSLELLSMSAPLLQAARSHDSTLSSRLITRLCELLHTQMDALLAARRIDADALDVIQQAFQVLVDWTVTWPAVLSEPRILPLVLGTFEHGLSQMQSGDSKRTKSNASPPEVVQALRDVTHDAFTSFVMNAGAFPASTGCAQIAPKHLEANDQCLLLDVDGQQTVTFMERPENSELVALVRSKDGKFAWSLRPVYEPLQRAEKDDPRPAMNDEHICSSDRSADEVDVLRDALDRQSAADASNRPSAGTTTSTLPVVAAQSRARRFFELTLGALPAREAELSTAAKFEALSTLSSRTPMRGALTRRFVSNIGWAAVDTIAQRHRIKWLEPSAKLLLNVKHMDRQITRDSHKIGVIYVAPEQADQYSILQNSSASAEFDAFLASLGWRADLDTHDGYMGGLDRTGATGTWAPYYATHALEAMFHVPSLMPTDIKDRRQIHKKRHVGNDHVHIVWCENQGDYHPSTISSQFNFVHVVVHPMANDLHRIRLHVRRDELHVFRAFGPLLDAMVVPRRLVGFLSRLTALSANRHVRRCERGFQPPLRGRALLLADIDVKMGSALLLPDMLSHMFAHRAWPSALPGSVQVVGLSRTHSSSSLPAPSPVPATAAPTPAAADASSSDAPADGAAAAADDDVA